MSYDPTLSTTQNLINNGFTHHRTKTMGVHAVEDDRCNTVFIGNIMEVNQWLRDGCHPVAAVTHDGGPDIADGAPSNGDI